MRSTCCAMDGLAAVRRYLAHQRRWRSSSDGLGRRRFHHWPVAQAASIRARKASNSPSPAPPLLYRRRAGSRVGHAGAALVEHDQPGGRGQPGQQVGQIRLLPGQLDVGDEPGHQHQVDRRVAQHLAGDIHLPLLAYLVSGRIPPNCNQTREPSQLAPRRRVAGGSAPTARSPRRGLARHRRVSLDRTGAARQPQVGRGRRDSCRLAAISGRDSLDHRGEMDQGWPARH
jgi:hypothetical protein